MIRFVHPAFLWLLALLPLLAFLKGRRGRTAALRFPSLAMLRGTGIPRKARAGGWLAALRLAALACFVVALARPQLGKGHTEVDASGIDIMLALDVSGSMEAMDFNINKKPVNRVEVVKRVVSRFIEERPNDRIGLIAFAGRPYLASPLTLDHDWLQQRLDSIHTGMVEDGTAVGSATVSAVNRLREQEAKSKIAILLTDGMSNAGKVQPITAAEAAKTLGIKVYTVGAGTRGEAPVPVTDQFGNRRMAMAKVDIDEATLTRMAEMTGGQYYRATDTDSLQRIYDEINTLETTTRKLKKYEQYRELIAWALIPGLLLLGTELGLAQTRFRRLP